MAVLSLFSWALLPKTYSTTLLQNIPWTSLYLLILTTVKSTKKAETFVKMLHVFHVDLGTIYTFEMELAMER